MQKRNFTLSRWLRTRHHDIKISKMLIPKLCIVSKRSHACLGLRRFAKLENVCTHVVIGEGSILQVA